HPGTGLGGRANPVGTPPPSGDRSLQRPPGSQPGTRPAPSLPNRSAGKLPPLAEEEVDFPPTPPVPPPIPTRSQARLPGRSPTPPVARPGKAAVAAKPVAEAQSAPLGWADEDATS